MSNGSVSLILNESFYFKLEIIIDEIWLLPVIISDKENSLSKKSLLQYHANMIHN
jgi:hypothetical protein